jgi:thioredoxin 1
MVKELSEAAFAETISEAAVPVLVDFWAPWCGACRSIGPVVEALAGEYADKLDVYKVNVDDNPALPEQFSIRAIPTLILFNNNEVQERITGAVSKANLQAVLDKALAG